jgi:hypothetical protein
VRRFTRRESALDGATRSTADGADSFPSSSPPTGGDQVKQLGILTALVAIAAIATGCGGGGSSTTASITKAEFVKKGNAICTAGNKRVQNEFNAYIGKSGLKKGEEPSKAEDEELAGQILLPSVSQEVEEIKALGIPSEEGEGAEAVIESAEESIEKGEEDPAALVTSEKTFAKTNELAHEYGLTVCGEE